MQQPHVPNEWRLFIDGSKESIKAVLIHIGNKHPSVPIAYGRNVKETYANLQAIRDFFQYEEFEWPIFGDLKVVGILMGLKSGYAKHQCFLCTLRLHSCMAQKIISSSWNVEPNTSTACGCIKHIIATITHKAWTHAKFHHKAAPEW